MRKSTGIYKFWYICGILLIIVAENMRNMSVNQLFSYLVI